jgi:hypothetical protein
MKLRGLEKLKLVRFEYKTMEIEKEIEDLKNRVSKIEKEVFIKKVNIKAKKTGLPAGINLLIERGFFNNPKSVSQTEDELEKEGYFCMRETLDRTLRRDFMKAKRVLTRVKKNNLWHYVLIK